MDIAFNEISPSDQIVIRTQNSEYRFSVLNPEERRGTLSGGSLGNQRREAVLAGVLTGGENNFASDVSGLKTGSRALFYLSAKNGVERLITSIITAVRRSESDSNQKEAA
jgi:hypothetical protein